MENQKKSPIQRQTDNTTQIKIFTDVFSILTFHNPRICTKSNLFWEFADLARRFLVKESRDITDKAILSKNHYKKNKIGKISLWNFYAGTLH